MENTQDKAPETKSENIETQAQTEKEQQTVPPTDNEQEQQQPVAGEELLEQQAEEQPSYEDLVMMLEDAQGKADEHWNQLVRTQAELENLSRRNERELEKARKFALESFAQELLSVKDSLELGLSAAQDESASVQTSVEKLVEGTELTLKMLQTVMEKFGIKEVNPINEPFNPELHQAMSMQESAEKTPNTVLMVFQKGYLLNDRLIRPARVVVSKASEQAVKDNEQARGGEPAGSESGDSIGTNFDEKA